MTPTTARTPPASTIVTKEENITETTKEEEKHKEISQSKENCEDASAAEIVQVVDSIVDATVEAVITNNTNNISSVAANFLPTNTTELNSSGTSQQETTTTQPQKIQVQPTTAAATTVAQPSQAAQIMASTAGRMVAPLTSSLPIETSSISNTNTANSNVTVNKGYSGSGSDDDDDDNNTTNSNNPNKRKERLEQNRISARESRKRKKSMIEELQHTVITLTSENKELNGRNHSLRSDLIEIGQKYPNNGSIQGIMNGVPNPSPQHHQQQQSNIMVMAHAQMMGSPNMTQSFGLHLSKQQQMQQLRHHPGMVTTATPHHQMPIPIVAAVPAPPHQTVPVVPFQYVPQPTPAGIVPLHQQLQQNIVIAPTVAAVPTPGPVPVPAAPMLIPVVAQAPTTTTMGQQHTIIAPQPSTLPNQLLGVPSTATTTTTHPKAQTPPPSQSNAPSKVVQVAPVASTQTQTQTHTINTTATIMMGTVPDPMAVAAAASETVPAVGDVSAANSSGSDLQSCGTEGAKPQQESGENVDAYA